MDSEIIPFNKQKHVPYMKMWVDDWRLPAYNWDCVPELGFVALHPKTQDPVAMLLIRQAEGHVFIVDYVITSLTAQRPSKTVTKLFEAAIDYAKTINVKMVIGVSRVASIIDRAKEYGFDAEPMTYLSRKGGF